MVALAVNQYGYIEVSSSDWLADIGEYSESLTESLHSWGEVADNGTWLTTENVIEWVRYRYGTDAEITGIYGEDGAVSVATCNEETFLTDDIGFVFLHVENETEFDTLVIVNAYGYISAGLGYGEVYRFTGNDDADIASYCRGYAVHDSDSNCGTDWILDDAVTLWANGGGQSVPVSDCIRETSEDSGEWNLYCPNCGIILHPFTN